MRGDGEGVGRLAGHAELAGGQLGGHVFAGLAGHGQLEVVDGRRAVQGHRAEQAALDPVDQVGPAAGLDDVPAERRDDRPAFARAPGRDGRGRLGDRSPASWRGSESSQSATEAPASTGRPRSSWNTFEGRDLRS